MIAEIISALLNQLFTYSVALSTLLRLRFLFPVFNFQAFKWCLAFTCSYFFSLTIIIIAANLIAFFDSALSVKCRSSLSFVTAENEIRQCNGIGGVGERWTGVAVEEFFIKFLFQSPRKLQHHCWLLLCLKFANCNNVSVHLFWSKASITSARTWWWYEVKSLSEHFKLTFASTVSTTNQRRYPSRKIDFNDL